MEKKKLLIASDTFPPRVDGVSRFLQMIVPELTYDFDVTIIAPDFGKAHSELDRSPWIKVIKFPIGKKQWGDFHLAMPNLKVLWREVRDSDVVFIQSIAPICAATIFFSYLMKKKVVIYTHVIEWQIALKNVGFEGIAKFVSRAIVMAVAKILYSKATLIITPSYEISEIFSNHGIKRVKKIIPLGIDPEKFFPPRDKRSAKREIGINPESTVIGYCGRLSKEKDLYTLNRAFLALKRSHPSLVLLIVGDGIPEIRDLFVNRENVYFAGTVEDTEKYYSAMDIFVMPSLTETSSLATMEAMSCGVAVISTQVGNIRDYLKNMKTGLFFKRRNSFDLARKIELLIKNSQLREELSCAGSKMIKENYNWKTTVAEIKKILVPLSYSEQKKIGEEITDTINETAERIKTGSEKIVSNGKEMLKIRK